MVSGYNERFRYDVIKSAVEGYDKQCRRADAGTVPLHRPRDFDEENRRKKKLMSKTSWFRPADAVLFVPATPNSELANRLRKVVAVEAARLGITVRVVETGGTKIKDLLVRPDLTGCIWPDCLICDTGEGGASHTRRGAVYQGTCLVCGRSQKLGRYDGETGESAYQRIHGDSGHKSSIVTGNIKNAFAKHIAVHHPERKGDVTTFKFNVKERRCYNFQV